MDKKTEQILTKDSLADAEKSFGGKHWSEFNDAENLLTLARCMHDNEIKNNHLKNNKDTYWGMSWKEFKELLSDKGFVNAYTYEFEYKSLREVMHEEAIIYYHPEKGLIIWAESFSNKGTINGGNLYGEIQAFSKDTEKVVWKWMSTGGCRDIEKLIYETTQDVREGLFSKIDVLESAGVFLKKWTSKNRFLWFVDYVEDDEPGFDYKKITREKIIKCTKELKEIIGYPELLEG